MNGLVKFSYLLLGLGIGIIGTSIFYDYERTKGLEDDEFYIPEDESEDEDLEDDLDDSEPEQSSLNDIIDEYDPIPNSVEKDKVSFEEARSNHNRNTRVRYSKMFKESVEKTAPLSQIEKDYLDYIQESPPDDEPDDDSELEYFDDKDLTVELVEPNYAIYIGDLPSDYAELYWYNNDSTLCDERDEIIPNPNEVIGTAAINRLIDRGSGAEDGVIYVRNMKTSINYEVTFCASSYSETVLGVFESRRKGAKDNGRL